MNNRYAFIMACEAYNRGQNFVGEVTNKNSFLSLMEACLGGRYRYAVEVNYHVTHTITVYGGELKAPYTIGFTCSWDKIGLNLFKEDLVMMIYRYYGGTDLNTYELIDLVREYIADNKEDFED